MWTDIGLRLTAIALGWVLLALGLGSLLPNGGEIAYVSGMDGDLDIYLRDLGHAMIFKLTRTPQSESQPDWSPDGSQMVFTLEQNGSTDLYIMQVNCPGIFAICSVPIRRMTNAPGNDTDPDWSPDGSQIVFTSERFTNREIMVIDVLTGAIKRLTDNDSLDANPDWSPDGSKIIFSTDRDLQWNTDLYLMDVDGGNPRPVTQTESNEFAAAWSPDGSKIVFVNVQLMILDMETSTYTSLLDDQGYDDTPAWSPNGETLALSALRPQDYEIYTLRLDCTGLPADCLHRLTFDPALDTMPVWRP